MPEKPTYEDLEREIKVLKDEVREQERSIGIHKERADRSRAVVEALRDALIMVDEAGRISGWNPAAEGLLGYPCEEALGRELAFLIPNRYHEAYRNALKSLKLKDLDAVDHRTFVSEATRKDESEIPVEFSVSPLRIKGESYLLILLRGIVERRKNETALRESELQHRVILNAVDDAIHVVDPDLRLILFNNKLEQLSKELGLKEDIMGKDLFEVFPFLSERVRNEYHQVFESGKVLLSEEINRIGDEDYITESRKIPVFSGGKVNRVITIIRDITRSRGAEDAIRKSEERFRTVFEAAPLGIAVADPEGKFLEFNNALCQMLNYTVADLLSMTFVDITHPDDRPETRRLADAVRDGTRDSYQLEKRYLRSDGRVVDVIVRAKGIRDTEGKLKYWLGIMEDITDRKRAETALRESEENVRTLVEDAPYAIAVMRPDKTFEYFNPKFTEILGYTKEDLPDKAMWFRKAYPDKAYRDKVISTWTSDSDEGTRPGGIRPKVFTVRCKGGQDKTIYFRAVNLKDGRQLFTCQDITSQAEAEKALQWELNVNLALARLSNALISSDYDIREMTGLILEHARGITGSAQGYISEMDPQTGNILCHTLTDRHQGLFPLEDQGRPLPVAPYGRHPSLWGHSLNTRESFFTNTPWNHQNSKGLPEGHSPIEKFLSVPVKIADEVVAQVSLANPGRDYTDRDLHAIEQISELYALALHRQRSEEERKKLEAQLQQAQKMEAIGTLAGGIAHDFNNLLMGIQGITSLMRLETNADHPFTEHLKGIEDHVKSAAQLTNQLLGFARGGKYEVKPTDLNALVESTIHMFGRTRKEITIHTSYQQDIWTVEVDKRQIEQVLLNLYVNAWQAMHEGGELFVETANIVLDTYYLSLYGLEPGNYVKISVKDTGIGMDEATRQRIFDPFFTTKEMGRGTGLGLASAYGIIKNHGGIINVYSEVGKGATFHIYLPVSLPACAEGLEEDDEQTDSIVEGSGTILLIDDEDTIIAVGRKILEKIGYKVFIAKSGREALETYEEKRAEIDLVILDIIMPGMGGAETFDNLKKINPRIKILLSSGYSLDSQATRILKRGCSGFIQKPFDINSLSRMIKQIMTK